MVKVAKLFSILIFIGIMTSCYDEEQFSNVPRIEFRSMEFVDTPVLDSLIIKFHFEDGDANLFITEFDFSSPYDLFVDSEPKILTADNIDSAVPPIFLAPVVLDNFIPIRFNGNAIEIITDAPTFPAFLGEEVYTNDVSDIVFECPNIINQDFAQTRPVFDTTDVTVYVLDTLNTYDPVFTQNISSEVPALYKETFYNFIIQFERIVSGDTTIIDFREEFEVTDCSLGNFNARIPFFDNDSRNGTITYNIIEPFLRIGIGDDLFRVRFFVYDRQGNKSNEVVSPVQRLSDITRD